MTSLIPLSQTVAPGIKPKTQQQCKSEVAMRGVASSLIIGMHFRLPPLGRDSRPGWYRVIHIDSDTREVTAKAITTTARGLRISSNVKILRILSEDNHLSAS